MRHHPLSSSLSSKLRARTLQNPNCTASAAHDLDRARIVNSLFWIGSLCQALALHVHSDSEADPLRLQQLHTLCTKLSSGALQIQS